ncbi:MAG: 2,3-bisphosphoglycerate-independent phosphoglycerate mutase [Patescibacteria group bacterium]
MNYKQAVLIILDGFGIAPPGKGNCATLAKMPYYNSLLQNYTHTVIKASGEEVGLPWGDVGNSEVGHGNLGAGRISYQSLPLINTAILNKSFFKNEALMGAIHHVKKNKSSLHIMGLISAGGVHSHIEHLFALLKLAKQNRIKKVYIHCFMDGRDMPKDSGLDAVKKIQKETSGFFSVGKIATLSGRFFAMDRDNNWDRIEKSYNTMTGNWSVGTSEPKFFADPINAVEDSYANKIYDEQMEPIVIGTKEKPVAKISKGDAVIFFNFRADRARQMTEAFVSDNFKGFKREKIEDLFFVCFTEYEKGLCKNIAFMQKETPNGLSETISKNNLKQFHTAETEKFAHVTFFFNSGREKPFAGEVHKVVPSPKVKSYDEKPEMSAEGVTVEAIKAIKEKYNFVLINFANPDMVGHTGNIMATIKGLELVDTCLKKIIPEVLNNNGVVVLTADHGNCEEKINLQNGRIEKEHTANPVPLVLIGKGLERKSDNIDLSIESSTGALADVAPTILSLLGLKKPEEMTGLDLTKVI